MQVCIKDRISSLGARHINMKFCIFLVALSIFGKEVYTILQNLTDILRNRFSDFKEGPSPFFPIN